MPYIERTEQNEKTGKIEVDRYYTADRKKKRKKPVNKDGQQVTTSQSK